MPKTTDPMTLMVKELLDELHKYEDFGSDSGTTNIPVSDLLLLMSVAQTASNCFVEYLITFFHNQTLVQSRVSNSVLLHKKLLKVSDVVLPGGITNVFRLGCLTGFHLDSICAVALTVFRSRSVSVTIE